VSASSEVQSCQGNVLTQPLSALSSDGHTVWITKQGLGSEKQLRGPLCPGGK
jgi:hypothetical protein